MVRIKIQLAQHIGSDLGYDCKTNNVGRLQHFLIVSAYLHAAIKSSKRCRGFCVTGRQ
jgi:hypothetical protein